MLARKKTESEVIFGGKPSEGVPAYEPDGQNLPAEQQQHVKTPETEAAAQDFLETKKNDFLRGVKIKDRANKSIDREVPEGLDPELVKQTMRGGDWGNKDMARYSEAFDKKYGSNTSPGTEDTDQPVSGQPVSEQPVNKGFNKEIRKPLNNFDSGMKNQQAVGQGIFGNEAGYNFSRRQTAGMADQNIKEATESVGGKYRAKGLNDAVNKNIDYFRSRTDMYTLGLFGDIWNMKSPNWTKTKDPKPIETTYETD